MKTITLLSILPAAFLFSKVDQANKQANKAAIKRKHITHNNPKPKNTHLTQTIGIVAGILTACSLLPQVIKILKEKEAENVSIAMLLVLMSGISLWIYYGFLREDLPIIATNIFSLLVNILTLVLTIKYK